VKIKFPFGQLVAAPAALDAFQRTDTKPLDYLSRHLVGDWGDVDGEDQQENEYSLQHGFRLLSAYTLPDGTRIWIITEADRNATTFLLPEEY
jgi:hypothetical protein